LSLSFFSLTFSVLSSFFIPYSLRFFISSSSKSHLCSLNHGRKGHSALGPTGAAQTRLNTHKLSVTAAPTVGKISVAAPGGVGGGVWRGALIDQGDGSIVSSPQHN
jgi:hypothetical protein